MSEHDPSSEANMHNEQREQETLPTSPHVWIGSLADYNAGRLHGDWIDAAVSGEELVDAARGVLATSHEPIAEEWAIFDHDGFGDYQPGEYESLEVVAAVTRGIVEHGLAFGAWANLVEADVDQFDNFSDAFHGSWDSETAWAESMLEDMGIEAEIEEHLPPWIRSHIRIDYEGFARDSQMAGDLHMVRHPEGVWVFDAR